MGKLLGKYKIYIILAVSITAGMAFWMTYTSEKPSNSLLTAEGGEAEVTGERGVVETLLQLRAVSLSGTLFSDPAFVFLRDFGTQIISEPVGRPNPFAPLSSRRSTTTTATTTATTTRTSTQGR